MTEVAGIFQTLERNACFDWWEESLFYKYEGQAVARYELEDQGTLTWTFLIETEEPTCRVFEGGDADADICVRMPADSWREVISDRASVFALIRSGNAQIEGDSELLARLYWGRERRSAETSVPEGFTTTGAYTQTGARQARA